jgi:hypothetical protein
MGHPANLLTDCFNDSRMIVSDVEYADASHEIEIPRAVRIPKLGSLSPVYDDRMSRQDASRNVLLAKLKNVL